MRSAIVNTGGAFTATVKGGSSAPAARQPTGFAKQIDAPAVERDPFLHGLRSHILSALAARGLSDRLSDTIAGRFLRGQSDLIERFRHCQHPDRLSDWMIGFEQRRFLLPRGSMPLDTSSQVTGNLAFLPTLTALGDRPRQYAAIIFSAISAWLDLRESRPSSSVVAGLTRLFAAPCDRLVDHSGSTSVLVMIRRRMFILQVIDQGCVIPVDDLEQAIRTMDRACETQSETVLPIITALPKPEAIRQSYLAGTDGRDAITAIEGTLMAFSFDCRLTDAAGSPDSLRGVTGHGHDRWFGKTNLFADGAGCLGLCVDHAAADGAAISDFVGRVLHWLTVAPNRTSTASNSETALVEAVPAMPEKLESRWRTHLADYRDRIGRLATTSCVIELPPERSGLLARALPLACQVAFFRLYDEDVDVYVPVSRGHAVSRGLDFVCDSAPGTADIVRTLHDSDYVDPDVVRSAFAWWKVAFFKSMQRPSAEKSLHYLHSLAEENGSGDDMLFRALGLTGRRAFPKLCLSVIPGHPRMPPAVFVPSPGGWSVGLVYHEAGGNLSVTTQAGQAQQAASEIERAINGIVELAV